MDQFNLGEPWIYRERMVTFPNTVFAELDTTDCNDTVNGICRHGLSLEQCMDVVINSKGMSGAGYHIELNNSDTNVSGVDTVGKPLKPGEKDSICIPMRTATHPLMNPTFRLRNKDVYPELKNHRVSAFIDHNVYGFPPNQSATVLFQDKFILQNVETGLYVDTPEFKTEITMSKKQSTNIQILPLRNSMFKNGAYIPVRHVDPVILNIPGSSLILAKGLNDVLEWEPRLVALENTTNTFYIYPTVWKKDYVHYRMLTYDETVYIMYQNLYLVEVVDGKLMISYDNYKNAKADKKNVTFVLKPNFFVYYCDDKTKTCNQIELDKTQKSDLAASYQGNMVFRNPNCGGGCDFFKHKSLNDLYDKQTEKDRIENLTVQPPGGMTRLVLFIGILVFFIVHLWKRWPLQSRGLRRPASS